ncbi:hypothetical protein EG359_22445 (plasmid) [Chryseobacterium joostei]|uniref:Uncharacterized protein n=1 Tax=Chryseobacterium joostei TaxID=112234 RepID=A0A1N7KHD3_9FLAO|nr:hypothetical protein [Chryseobacterium joostei]AZB02421.1 hypothetical protein EG359_22445 [Chryseobacterium joostei]SIS61008.1 hypothetical protein SAMN05421768_11239 [Chryseobacterium joostei]
MKKRTRQEVISLYTQGATNINNEDFEGNLIVTFEKLDCFYYMVFSGRKINPAYYNRTISEDSRAEKIAGIKDVLNKTAEKKKEFFDNRKKIADAIQEGTVLYSSWGYEQTNINFYLVISRTNSTVTLQEIGQNREYEGQDHGTCTPNKEILRGEPFQKRITKYASVKINEVQDASKYDGSKLSWSSWY